MRNEGRIPEREGGGGSDVRRGLPLKNKCSGRGREPEREKRNPDPRRIASFGRAGQDECRGRISVWHGRRTARPEEAPVTMVSGTVGGVREGGRNKSNSPLGRSRMLDIATQMSGRERQNNSVAERDE